MSALAKLRRVSEAGPALVAVQSDQPPTRAEAAQLQVQAAAAIERLNAQRRVLGETLSAAGRKLAEKQTTLSAAAKEHTALRQRMSDAALLADVCPTTIEPVDSTRLIELNGRLELLQDEVYALEALQLELQETIARLADEERTLAQRAEDARIGALLAERTALLDAATRAKVVYMLAIRACGEFNRANELLDLSAAAQLKHPVQPIAKTLVDGGLPQIAAILGGTVEPDTRWLTREAAALGLD